MIKHSYKKIMLSLLSLFMIATTFISIVRPISYTAHAQDDRNLATRVLCKFEDGQALVNLQSTDYFHYMIRSKSALAQTQNVNSYWLNGMLKVAGFDFTSVNESILGRELSPRLLSEEELEVNQGPKVSAFDRFGVAGLTWSSYQGEWKYYQVNGCAAQNQVSPTNYGQFYDGRQEPKSTHNEVSTSRDPRTIQFDKGTMSAIGSAMLDIFSNFIFALAKVAVAFTIVFVGLAFSDITSLMGLSADGTAGASATGLFVDLFNTIFSGFIVLSIVLTGIYLLYNGIIRRQARMAIGSLIKTIIIFFVAIIMSSNPAYWMGVPNKVATYGQALVLSSMAGTYENDPNDASLCTTDVSSIDEGVDFFRGGGSKLTTEFEKVNKNMKSLIGCQMWEQLLFKPWVRGQFGAEYDDLKSDNVNNINSEWVGTPTVPLGNEQTVENWALFHLSTQTNVHSAIGESNFPVLVNGVNSDWWRIADALSNYHEDEKEESLGEGVPQETIIDQVESSPTRFWQSWIGNNSTERIGTAFTATIFALAGSVGPLIFSFSSALYGVAITLMMVTAPLFLLLGTIGENGERIFKGWLSALANTVLKRIGVSILLVLSISISMNIMDLVYTIGVIRSFMLMVVVMGLLIKNKNKILNMLASVDFGGAFDPREKANQFMQTQNTRAKSIGKIGLATAAGAKAGLQTGQGAKAGARIGARSQIRNTLYQSQLGVNIIREQDLAREQSDERVELCIVCYKQLGVHEEEIVHRDENGNYYCDFCAQEMGSEDLYEVIMKPKEQTDDNFVDIKDTRRTNATRNRSYLSHSKTREMMNIQVTEENITWDDTKVRQMALDNFRRLREDIIVFKNFSKLNGMSSRPPVPPETLQGYIDIALLNRAWTDGRMDVVEKTYKESWKMWYEENAQFIDGISESDIDEFKKAIEEYEPNIDPETARKLIKASPISSKQNQFDDEDLYIYRNGELVLNIYDREVDYKEIGKNEKPKQVENPIDTDSYN